MHRGNVTAIMNYDYFVLVFWNILHKRLYFTQRMLLQFPVAG